LIVELFVELFIGILKDEEVSCVNCGCTINRTVLSLTDRRRGPPHAKSGSESLARVTTPDIYKELIKEIQRDSKRGATTSLKIFMAASNALSSFGIKVSWCARPI
jgi:hypothetical protein